MKRIAALFAFAAVALVLAAGSSAAPKTASLQINHFVRGCHNWSLNGGAYKVNQTVTLARGGTLLLTNNDLMVQDLVKTSGPAVRMKLTAMGNMSMGAMMQMGGKASPSAMAHMGARLQVTFATPGTYRFKLVDRGDYFKNIKTVGPDNKLTLIVRVA